MKQSDFFEKLNRELENAVPPMSERLKDEPICTHKDEPVRTQAEADTAERAKKPPSPQEQTPLPRAETEKGSARACGGRSARWRRRSSSSAPRCSAPFRRAPSRPDTPVCISISTLPSRLP